MLVPSWDWLGTNLVPSWYRLGTCLVPAWYQVGTKLVPAWYRLGIMLVPSLCWLGTGLDNIFMNKCKYYFQIHEIWSKIGPGLRWRTHTLCEQSYTPKYNFYIIFGSSFGEKSNNLGRKSDKTWRLRSPWKVTVGAPAKIDPCRARVKGPDLIFWKNVEMPKQSRNLVENYFSWKCPKSISLDSGHLD